MTEITYKKNGFETSIGIITVIIIVAAVVVYAIFQELGSFDEYRFEVLTSEGDLSNSFTLVISLIITPVFAVYLSIYIYRKQKREELTKENKKIRDAQQTRLNGIIEPLIDNVTTLIDGYELFRKNKGPYSIAEFERKDTCLENIGRVLDRFSLSPEPDDAFIEKGNRLRLQAMQYPITQFSQYSTETVIITDCTECESIYNQFIELQNNLKDKRKMLLTAIVRLRDE